MRKIEKRILLGMLMWLLLLAIPGTGAAANDRKFDQHELNELRQQKQYDYDRTIVESESWLGKVFEAIWKFFSTFFGGTLGYIVVGIIVVLLILVIIRSASGNLYRNKTSENNLILIADEEDIKEVDLDALLKKALDAGDFRLSIRYLYLIALKNLDARDLIRWEKEKTNHDYIHELKQEKLKGNLRQLTLIFEYTWYGELPVNKESYEVLQQDFHTFNQIIRT